MLARRRKPVLETERLALRLPVMGDYRAWSDLRRASRDFLLEWEPSWPSDHLSRRAFATRVSWASRVYRAGVAVPLFLFLREGGAFVGGITVDGIRRDPAESASLGYWIGVPFARQGYMQEALSGVVGHCFQTLGLSRLEAACMPENLASKRLLANAGFFYEGTARHYLRINGRWRHHTLYALLREDRAVEAGGV